MRNLPAAPPARRRQQLARLRLDDQEITAAGTRLIDGIVQHRLGQRLQLGVDRQVDVTSCDGRSNHRSQPAG
jgi:hypothetical protein